MGNHSYKLSQLKVIKPNSDHWKPIHQTSFYQIVTNINTGIKGERYIVTISDIINEAEIYQIRQNNPKFFVSVHQISLNRQEMFCSNTYSLEVITQHVQYRLADVGVLEKIQALSILLELIDSCQKIHEYFGIILFDQNMVCRCSDNRWKLWINQNIEKNNIQNQSQLSIKQMIQNLFDLIVQRCPSLSTEQNFSQQNYLKEKYTFMDARRYINEIIQQEKQKQFQAKLPKKISPINKNSQLTFKTNITTKQLTESTSYLINSPSTSQIFELWSQKDCNKNMKCQDFNRLCQDRKEKFSLATKKQKYKFCIGKKKSNQKKQQHRQNTSYKKVFPVQPFKNFRTLENSEITGAVNMAYEATTTEKQILQKNSPNLMEFIKTPDNLIYKRHRSSKILPIKDTIQIYKYKSAQRKDNQKFNYQAKICLFKEPMNTYIY